MEHRVFSEILPSILECLEVLDALRVIGKSAHRLDDGILTFHNLLRLLGGGVLSPWFGFGQAGRSTNVMTTRAWIMMIP